MKIKKCPFCGGKPNLSKYKDESLWSHNIVIWSSIMCSNCDYIMNFCDDEDYSQAIKAWNNACILLKKDLEKLTAQGILP